MSLVSRISLADSEGTDPEDFLSESLGVVFPDDVTNQHGDAASSLVYTSPHLPKALQLGLAQPADGKERGLFSHFLWNASLLLAELVERDSHPELAAAAAAAEEERGGGGGAAAAAAPRFDIRGSSIVELGAGTALPSIMGGLLGASKVVVTDYPAPHLLQTLRANVARNVQPGLSPLGRVSPDVSVLGHVWGQFDGVDDGQLAAQRHAFDRVLVCDCLWMPQQHANLQRSIDHLLAQTPQARCWVVAGFHSGRPAMAGFFDGDMLRDNAGCEVETIWEQDCDERQREWRGAKELEDPGTRKRWLVVAVLKRTRDKLGGTEEEKGRGHTPPLPLPSVSARASREQEKEDQPEPTHERALSSFERDERLAVWASA